MNDCTNAEIRDQLPDLLHDRLTVSVRAIVVAHVADCADCREELELLRGVHGVLISRTPRVDVSQIVAALPKPFDARVSPITRAPARRMMRMDWRIAAAVTFLAVGGSSVALLNRTPGASRAFPDSNVVATMPVGAPVAASAAAPATAADSAASRGSSTPDSTSAPVASAVAAVATVASNEAASSSADAEAAADVSPGGRFAGLTEAQLKALLGDIGQLPDVPVTEPDPVTIQVNTNSPDGP